jgi:hypothetical protein
MFFPQLIFAFVWSVLFKTHTFLHILFPFDIIIQIAACNKCHPADFPNCSSWCIASPCDVYYNRYSSSRKDVKLINHKSHAFKTYTQQESPWAALEFTYKFKYRGWLRRKVSTFSVNRKLDIKNKYIHSVCYWLRYYCCWDHVPYFPVHTTHRPIRRVVIFSLGI